MSDPTRCKVEGCEKRRYARERCKGHHSRALATGEIKPLYARKNKSQEDKFWSKVKGGDVESCWLWTGGTTTEGHGRFCPSGYSGRGSLMAHRWSYQQLIGDIPDGLVLDHLCRTTSCVNPWHLEPVTQRVNVLRGEGVAALNAQKSTCPNGHEYDWHWKGVRMCRQCKNHRARKARLLAGA